MIYLGNKSSGAIAESMSSGALGMMCTPAEGKTPASAAIWAADNGCFGRGYPGDDKYLAWLRRHAIHADRCLFATAPDVMGDAAATLVRSAPFFPLIRELGYPAALVAQDGLQELDVPWDTFDVLFIGGTTGFKLSHHAERLVAEAKRRGKWVHVGRVNSRRRLLWASGIGTDSVDGTYLVFGPNVNLPHVLSWVAEAKRTQVLPFESER